MRRRLGKRRQCRSGHPSGRPIYLCLWRQCHQQRSLRVWKLRRRYYSREIPQRLILSTVTFASANSAPTLTVSGAGPFATGIAQGSVPVDPTATTPTTYTGSFAQGSYVPGVPAGSTNVFFRAQGAQGQTASRGVPDITAATLSVEVRSGAELHLPSVQSGNCARDRSFLLPITCRPASPVLPHPAFTLPPLQSPTRPKTPRRLPSNP